MRTFVKIMVAVIAATGAVLVLAQHGVGFKACTIVYMFVGVMTAAIQGVFNERKQVRVNGRVKSEKFATARRGYRRAA
jgi:hypothetical protein